MTPMQRYQDYIVQYGFTECPQQKIALAYLQQVYEAIIHSEQQAKYWQNRLAKYLTGKSQLIKGVYLWGHVGVGKTWLMDIFYDALPEENKYRVHFHRFMQQVHQQLKQLQGEMSPLQKVAKQLANQTRVICLDEFLVTDIADAMILENLLHALFAEGIVLITTANTPPQDLYKEGLQQDRFAPARKLLQQHLTVVQVAGQDFRLRAQEAAGTYFYPLNAFADEWMQKKFIYYTKNTPVKAGQLQLLDRLISVNGYSDQVVWFDFEVICSPPRSQLDFLEIAKHFKTVLISNVPKINPEQHNKISYFIKLIDVFYDAGIKLILTAAVPVKEIYTKGRLLFEFQRTQSRLIEMQGEEYLLKK